MQDETVFGSNEAGRIKPAGGTDAASSNQTYDSCRPRGKAR